MLGHRRLGVALVAAVSIALVGAGCTTNPPPGGTNLVFQATSITNVNLQGDWPLTFWDSNPEEEPYLIHLGLRLKLNSPISVTTSVASTYLNGGRVIGTLGAGQTQAIAPGDGVAFSGVSRPDVLDLAMGANFEILGSVEFLMERDQLVTLGLANILVGVSQAINAALPPILANGGLPSDAPGLISFLGTLLPSVFTVLGGVLGSVIGQLAGADQFIGLSIPMFLSVGGALAGILGGALPSLISLVNFALSQRNPNPFPNGLPFTIGIVGQGYGNRFGTAPGSVYDVSYGWAAY